jgi:hypothetical protein
LAHPLQSTLCDGKVWGFEDFGDQDYADIVVTADILPGTR